jgi:TIR domain
MADTVTSPAERLKVFISYARADSATLADELATGLDLAGVTPFLDRHDIAAAEDWEARQGPQYRSFPRFAQPALSALCGLLGTSGWR